MVSSLFIGVRFRNWIAFLLNHHCDCDIAISTYETHGLVEAFISGEGEIGMTVNGKKRSGKITNSTCKASDTK